MPWILFVLFLNLIVSSNLSEARHHEKRLSSAIVVGTVYCDTCFQESLSKNSHFISGAIVAVECKDGNSKPSFRDEVKTDKQGEFRVHLPFSVSKDVKKVEGCSVNLVRSSEPYCAVASRATSSSLHLKLRKEGEHIFSAGFFTFKPLKQPDLCNQKPVSKNIKELNSMESFVLTPNNPLLPSPVQNPTVPNLPPLPKLPDLPPLPELPLPGVPLPPTGKTTEMINRKEEQFHPEFFFPPVLPPNPLQPPPLIPNPLQPPPLIPNPLQPPPAPLIPNPFQPPPAPLIPNPFQPPPAPLIPNPFQPPPAPLIPNPFQPPPAPAPFFHLPPIPGFTPSPPPPPPPSLPLPFPPFPIPPVPRIPGIPPAPPTGQTPP